MHTCPIDWRIDRVPWKCTDTYGSVRSSQQQSAVAKVMHDFGDLLGPDQIALMERTLDDLRQMRMFLDDNRR